MTDDPIRAAVAAYYHAMVAGDGPALRRVFDAQARFQGWRDDTDVRRDLDAFVAMVEAPAADPDLREDWEIGFIHRTGPIAVASVIDWYRGRYYTDYLTLALHGGEWVIVNKCFFAHPPETASLAAARGEA